MSASAVPRCSTTTNARNASEPSSTFQCGSAGMSTVWPRLLTGNSSLTPCSTARIMACTNVTTPVGSHAGEAFPLARKAARVSDARSYRRLSDTPLLVAYTIGDDFPAAHTETYDLGLGGLAMLADAELPAGQALRLQLELRGDPRPAL